MITLKLPKLLSLVVICFLLASCGRKTENHAGGGAVAKICFIPFDYSTSAPMTAASFSRSCSDLGTINVQDRRYRKILSLVQAAQPGPFLDAGIKVSLTLPDSTVIYIDDSGGVIMGASQVKLDKYGFMKVKRIFNRIAKKKGVPGVD